MCLKNRSDSQSLKDEYLSLRIENSWYSTTAFICLYLGGGAIATPGDVAGLWMAHQHFGRLKWSRLFEPSISLLENGITLNEYVGEKLSLFYKEFDDELK